MFISSASTSGLLPWPSAHRRTNHWNRRRDASSRLRAHENGVGGVGRDDMNNIGKEAKLLPRFRQVDYAEFRQLLSLPENSRSQHVVDDGHNLFIADRYFRVLAKMERPAVDHWGHVQCARYYAPARPSRLPLRALLMLSLRNPLPQWRRNCQRLALNTLNELAALLFARANQDSCSRCPATEEPRWVTLRLTA